uniref:Zinc finger MYND-type containing 12 n=1 Tax=Otolemur garnettii TaxID=30611 RepID=H0XC72_OTOGA
MNVIYPLAVPKGRRLCCEVCEAPAERVCAACTVTYYCGVVHQRADWRSIHEKICQLLIPLRTSMPFYNSEEERQHGLQQLQQRQMSSAVIKFCLHKLKLFLILGRQKKKKTEPILIEGQVFLRVGSTGLADIHMVANLFMLGVFWAGLGRIIQAEEYLLQAQWTVLKSTDCSNATHSLLHRNLGLLYMAKKNYEEARYHLANDIYFASCAFGTEDIRTSGGYFHLANIFYILNKMDLADTLYTKVSDIWNKYMNEQYKLFLQNEAQQDLLGKRFEKDTSLDEAQEAEAIRILTSILNIRESTSDEAPEKIIILLKTLVMLYHLMLNYSKAKEYAARALHLAKEQLLGVSEENTIQELIRVISSEDHPM